MGLPAPKPTIDTCNHCGKLFPRLGVRLCTTCAPVKEHRFELVRDYILDNDGAAVTEIARATGVGAGDVRRFMESGRLVEIRSGLTACTCGGVGTRCRFCRASLAGQFRDMEQTMQDRLADAPTPARLDERTSYVRRIRRLGEH